jgi:hypothetical protein
MTDNVSTIENLYMLHTFTVTFDLTSSLAANHRAQ